MTATWASRDAVLDAHPVLESDDIDASLINPGSRWSWTVLETSSCSSAPTEESASESESSSWCRGRSGHGFDCPLGRHAPLQADTTPPLGRHERTGGCLAMIGSCRDPGERLARRCARSGGRRPEWARADRRHLRLVSSKLWPLRASPSMHALRRASEAPPRWLDPHQPGSGSLHSPRGVWNLHPGTRHACQLRARDQQASTARWRRQRPTAMQP